MNGLRHDPNVTYITHSDRLGVMEEVQVRSGPRVANGYDVRTSTERIDELNARLDAVVAELRALSEQMQAGR